MQWTVDSNHCVLLTTVRCSTWNGNVDGWNENANGCSEWYTYSCSNAGCVLCDTGCRVPLHIPMCYTGCNVLSCVVRWYPQKWWKIPMSSMTCFAITGKTSIKYRNVVWNTIQEHQIQVFSIKYCTCIFCISDDHVQRMPLWPSVQVCNDIDTLEVEIRRFSMHKMMITIKKWWVVASIRLFIDCVLILLISMKYYHVWLIAVLLFLCACNLGTDWAIAAFNCSLKLLMIVAFIISSPNLS